MADDHRWKPARWRKYNDTPPVYRLRRRKEDLAEVRQNKSGSWYWLTRGDVPPRNTETAPMPTLHEAQDQAKRWIEENGF